MIIKLFISTLFFIGYSQEQTAEKKDTNKPNKQAKSDYVTVDSTKFDFEEGLIEGQMKAPEGFFLRGRASPKLQQMVQLRTNFRPELRKSSFGVRALAK